MRAGGRNAIAIEDEARNFATCPLLHHLHAETPPAWQSDLVAGDGWADRLLLAAGLGKSLTEVSLPDNLPESTGRAAYSFNPRR